MAPVTRKSLEPWIRDEVEYYPHQISGVRHLAKQKSFLLGDDMGLGKCLQSLTVFAIDVYRGWVNTCIIVCPILLKGNWADEIEKFTRFPYRILEGNGIERAKQLMEFRDIEGPKILIVNYEQVQQHLKFLNGVNFDVSIFDESHYLKNPKSARTKAGLELRSHRSFMLSGTPMLNSVDELWSALHRIDPRGYPDYYRFVNRYCVFGGYNGRQVTAIKNEHELTERLQRVMLRRLKSDVLDLPEVQIIERRVALSKEQQELYDLVDDEMKLQTLDEGIVDIEFAIAKFLRLKQICGTTLPFTGLDISSKLDLGCADDMEVLAAGKKVVMFTQFRATLEAYVKRMEDSGIQVFQLHGDIPIPDRMPTVRRWTASKGPNVIACMLQVAREGVNLVAAADANFQDLLFVPGLNQQAIDRMHRIGADKTRPVRIRQYIARGTIENRIQQILREKKKLSAQIIDADPMWKSKLVKAVMEEEEDE
jgi:SNF2 family DNA or RNA helicase